MTGWVSFPGPKSQSVLRPDKQRQFGVDRLQHAEKHNSSNGVLGHMSDVGCDAKEKLTFDRAKKLADTMNKRRDQRYPVRLEKLKLAAPS